MGVPLLFALLVRLVTPFLPVVPATAGVLPPPLAARFHCPHFYAAEKRRGPRLPPQPLLRHGLWVLLRLLPPFVHEQWFDVGAGLLLAVWRHVLFSLPGRGV